MNADAPYWLVGMTEMTRTFGLELLESVLKDFPGVFLQVSTFNCASSSQTAAGEHAVLSALNCLLGDAFVLGPRGS